METGQINRGSNLGELIYTIVSDKKIKTIVEIGLWKGMGSTKCILDALIDSKKENFDFHSFEINKKFYDEALINLQPTLKNIDNSKVHLIYGSIISDKEFPEFNSKEMVYDGVNQDIIYGWYTEDFNNCKNAPKYNYISKDIDLDGGEFSTYTEYLKFKNAPRFNSKDIDLLILDGGEFSTYTEYLKFKNKFNIIVLDDVKCYKTKKIREELLNDNNYIAITDVLNDRNGYSIFQKEKF